MPALKNKRVESVTWLKTVNAEYFIFNIYDSLNLTRNYNTIYRYELVKTYLDSFATEDFRLTLVNKELPQTMSR